MPSAFIAHRFHLTAFHLPRHSHLSPTHSVFGPLIFPLQTLVTLNLSANLIEVIPVDIKLLTALESLDLSDNRLSRLPPLNTLKSLRRLDLVRATHTLHCTLSGQAKLHTIATTYHAHHTVTRLGALKMQQLSHTHVCTLALTTDAHHTIGGSPIATHPHSDHSDPIV